MKLVYIFILFGLMGCSGGNTCEAPAKTREVLTYTGDMQSLRKFRDGDVVCYYKLNYGNALSCVVLPELKHE